MATSPTIQKIAVFTPHTDIDQAIAHRRSLHGADKLLRRRKVSSSSAYAAAINPKGTNLNVYLLTLGKGLTGPSRMNGALFLGEHSMHFLCASLGVSGGYEFGALGPIGAQLDQWKKSGGVLGVTEAEVAALVPSVPHSFSIPSGKVEQLSRAFCAGSKIVHDGGQKLVVWAPGFAGTFRNEAKAWATSRGIATAGL